MTQTVILGEKPLSFKWFLSWGAILLGSALLAIGLVIFITPYNLVPGGVYGIGIILHHFFPNIMIGTFGIAMDIPLLILAFYALGSGVGAKTIFSAVVTPLMINLFTTIIGNDPALMFGGSINLTDDLLLAAVFGGLVMGVGLGMIFVNHGTSGGTDIVSMIVSKYGRIPLSKAIIFVESGIILSGLLIGSWKLPLYSVICVFVLTRVIDYIVEGGTSNKLLFIISDKQTELREYIINELERGATLIKAEGMYTRNDKNIIFVVIDRKQLPLIQSTIKAIDPKAFLVVVEAHETLGDGFKAFDGVATK